MNCKPGDLAFYVGLDQSQWGRVVRCIEIHPFSQIIRVNCWITDPQLPVKEMDGRLSEAIYDSSLRPIRDPGDDAVDESKAWLPPVPLPAICPEMIPEKEGA
ncbi:hypothetical protein [Variovorax sp. GB1P17]|uniref:hypothetical protein n=1 Tax=Variovorax sp. GB1P17 TaxID=3443740 RepID=UPI003F4599A0